MKKIASIGLLIGALVCILSLGYFGISEFDDIIEVSDRPEFFISVIFVGIIISVLIAPIYYVIATKFGREVSGIESIELETRIIKIQIEKRELLAKLEALEKK